MILCHTGHLGNDHSCRFFARDPKKQIGVCKRARHNSKDGQSTIARVGWNWGVCPPPPSRFPCCVFHICSFDICHETQQAVATPYRRRQLLNWPRSIEEPPPPIGGRHRLLCLMTNIKAKNMKNTAGKSARWDGHSRKKVGTWEPGSKSVFGPN